MSHAFLSYVRDDQKIIDQIEKLLRANGVAFWRDTRDLQVGLRWKEEIRAAIREGKFYVPLFSRAWSARERTMANQELTIAIDELQLRPRHRAWFIPVQLDVCECPNWPIGGGETLSDIQRLSVPDLGYKEAMHRLLIALGVQEPVLDAGERLAPGLASSVEVTSGEIVIEQTEPRLPGLPGMMFSISGGTVWRGEDGTINSFLKSRAPNAILQKANEQLGLSDFYSFCSDAQISANAAEPSVFRASRKLKFAQGHAFFNPSTSETVALPYDLDAELTYEARGSLDGMCFSGTFSSVHTYISETGRYSVPTQGSFFVNLINP